MANNDIKVSVIMPVYNVEDFVEKCINSVLGQTLHEIEVFAVDDGSTDKSGQICDELAKKDKRLKVIHKKNGGAPLARNVAIEKARGKYLYFIDSDDWIENDYIKNMYQLAEEYKADLVVTGFLMEYFQNGKTVTYSTKCDDKIYRTKNEFRKNAYKYFNNSLLGLPWNKLFRREIVTKENIRFPNTKWDDTHFNLDYLMNVSCVVMSSMMKYHWYRSRAGAETMIVYSDPKMFKTRLAHYEHILRLYKHWGMSDDQKSIEAIDSFFVGRVFQCIQEFADNKTMSWKQKYTAVKKILSMSIVQKAIRNAKDLSPKLRILVLPMRVNNVTISLWFGYIVSMVRRRYKNLFIKLKEKEVHG